MKYIYAVVVHMEKNAKIVKKHLVFIKRWHNILHVDIQLMVNNKFNICKCRTYGYGCHVQHKGIYQILADWKCPTYYRFYLCTRVESNSPW